ncbi:hypothetical protein [Hyphomicrobium sp.]|uniref:hypothetical protein n=1 Tax=Hyphomicrobium sp. TaxID=82 RepID=UPI002E352060|nr:hypothetical protein [Hyphomicrobium sp.]HEX2842066.1 hypothetical protein [Hyphomicrobium sp.]
MRYDHAFTIAFSITSHHKDVDDIKPQQFRNAILARLASLVDDELLEAVGFPFDTFVIETAAALSKA